MTTLFLGGRFRSLAFTASFGLILVVGMLFLVPALLLFGKLSPLLLDRSWFALPLLTKNLGDLRIG